MRQDEPGSRSTPCPSCGGALGRGLSECPHCGEMAPLRISADPVSLAEWLVRVLVVVVAGFLVKLLLLG